MSPAVPAPKAPAPSLFAGMPEPATRWLGRRRFPLDEVGSTNDAAWELLQREGPSAHGAVFYTDRQRAGRGRHGRSWIVPPGRSLALSVCLWPQADQGESLALLPPAAAAAVAETVRSLSGAEARLKWPNDVLVEERKIAGTILEASWAGEKPAGAVLGIGVNLLQEETDWPPELRHSAASLAQVAPRLPEAPVFLSRLLEALESFADSAFGRGPALGPRLEPLWIHRLGERLRVSLFGGEAEGTFAGFGPAGELLLETPGGLRAIRNGDAHRVGRNR